MLNSDTRRMDAIPNWLSVQGKIWFSLMKGLIDNELRCKTCERT